MKNCASAISFYFIFTFRQFCGDQSAFFFMKTVVCHMLMVLQDSDLSSETNKQEVVCLFVLKIPWGLMVGWGGGGRRCKRKENLRN